MSQIELLDRVGGLILLPNTEIATTKQVAEFYGVPIQTIHSVIRENKDEFESDGYKIMDADNLMYRIDTLSSHNKVSVTRGKGGYFVEGVRLFSYSPTGVFTKRAVLRVGFLLEKSTVAKEVRNQALNIIENTSDENKVVEINKEKDLLMAIMFAGNEVVTLTNLWLL